MLRLYEEDPEFTEFTIVNSQEGLLKPILKDEFERYAADTRSVGSLVDKAFILRDENYQVFSGETFKTHTRFPRRLYFQITRHCDLECPYCYIKAGHSGLHVPFSAIRSIARYMGDHGLIEVRLTGGEPTTHTQFSDIVRIFQENHVYVSIATNGVFPKDVLNGLAELNSYWLICTVDGNRETHNRYRNNSYDALVNNLYRLRERNPAYRLRLTMVLTSENRDQIDDVARLAVNLQAENITIIPLRPQVRDSKMSALMVTAVQFEEVIRNLVKAREKYGVSFTTSIETIYKPKMRSDPVFTKRATCAAGREGVNLDYDATTRLFQVYGCSYCPASDLTARCDIRQLFLAGTFKISQLESFGNIWREDKRWMLFRDPSLKAKKCLACSYYASHTCTGSCPIQNIDYTALLDSKDPLGALKAQIRNNNEWYCYI